MRGLPLPSRAGHAPACAKPDPGNFWWHAWVPCCCSTSRSMRRGAGAGDASAYLPSVLSDGSPTKAPVPTGSLGHRGVEGLVHLSPVSLHQLLDSPRSPHTHFSKGTGPERVRNAPTVTQPDVNPVSQALRLCCLAPAPSSHPGMLFLCLGVEGRNCQAPGYGGFRTQGLHPQCWVCCQGEVPCNEQRETRG